MEGYHGRGRRENGVCGLSRGNQTRFLTAAMVASMILVLFWETRPFHRNDAAPLTVTGVPRSELDEETGRFESTFLNPSESFLKPILKDKLFLEKDKDTIASMRRSEQPPYSLSVRQEDSKVETERKSQFNFGDGRSPIQEVPQQEIEIIVEESTLAEENRTRDEGDQAVNRRNFEPESRKENGTSSNQLRVMEKEKDSKLVLHEITQDTEESIHIWKGVVTESSANTIVTDKQIPEEMIISDNLEDRRTTEVYGTPSDKISLEKTKFGGMSRSFAMENVSVQEALSQEPVSENVGSMSDKCDYSIGKWVLDETRPLYSGLECKMWLAPSFSCRLNNHPDKQFDRYRWQPAGCDLPAFNASAVLELLRNKVLAFVGDSLGCQQLQSFMCMLTRGKNDTLITDVGPEFGFYIPKGQRKPTGYAHRFEATNTTIIFWWTATLARVQPLNQSDPLTRNALHLDQPERFLEEHLDQLDVVVLNSGHHWNGGKMKINRYDFYNKGKLVDREDPLSRIPDAYNLTVHNVVNWISKTIENTGKYVFYRSLSPRHFRNGDWNTGGTCDSIRFDKDVQVQEGNPIDLNAESAIRGTNVHLLNITSLSLQRGETHISKYGGGKGGQDCLHWCLPGIPDTWNEILFAEIASKFKGASSLSEQQL